MKTFFTSLVILFVTVFSVNSQPVSVANGIPNGIHAVQSPTYGVDYLVNAFEPAGMMSSAQRSNGDLYLSVNDTSTTTNLGIIVFRSTNNGYTWSRLTGGIQPKAIFQNLKMVSSGNDSLYLFFLFGSDAYRWNIVNNSFGKVTGDSLIRSFDVCASSTGALYMFYDRNYNTNVRRFGSIDGGFTWTGAGNVSTTASRPKIYMSGSGDTLILNYYGPVLSDTATSYIRTARYRETAPGTLSGSGFQDVVTDNTVKTEFASVFKNGVVWFIYTTGTTGNIDIKCRVSTNSGANYNAAINFAANPNVDEYWFSAKHYQSGLDVNFYSDSLQSGPPTNNTDKIVNKYVLSSNPENIFTVTGISSHPPVWSERGYKPETVENYQTTQYGVFWVGLDGTARKLYFDGLLPTNLKNTGTTVADKYSLSQNYPNPFNPTTKIDFAIPKQGFVSIKVYNMLGKEVAILVSKEMTPGSYSFDYNASKLSSGVYFYKMEVNGFSEVKKMMLVK